MISLFYSEEDLKEMLINNIKEIEKNAKSLGGGAIADSIKANITQFYLNHEDLFTDTECEIVNKLEEE